MRRLLVLVGLAALAALPFPQVAQAGHQASHSEYDALIETHAKANNVPEALVHRVILRESRYQPNLVGRCGCIGLMQIKLATARSLGYTGDAQGLRDPNTNLTYGVKYLAGAYRAANGDHTVPCIIMRAAITRPPSASGCSAPRKNMRKRRSILPRSSLRRARPMKRPRSPNLEAPTIGPAHALTAGRIGLH